MSGAYAFRYSCLSLHVSPADGNRSFLGGGENALIQSKSHER